MTDKLLEFNKFLKDVDLKKYREKYSKIKTVELDLPKNIQCIRKCYEYYWEKFELLSFEKFYEKHLDAIKDELENFRKKSFFSHETFYLGYPARMYRTWASLITQIQGGYVASSIHHKVNMSADLDYSGIDFQIYFNDEDFINIQIKKETLSREARIPKKIQNKRKQEIINISYEVLSGNKHLVNGEESKPYKRWKERYKNKLEILENGFVIFKPNMFDKANFKVI
tara:strand:- start:162 stop:839 length:678 start_codon:yes stop_codon:yes gene_type:complete